MSTVNSFRLGHIRIENQIFSELRTIIETAFYGNNVEEIDNLSHAYELAKEIPGVIITDVNIFESEKQGLPNNAKIIISNDGKITARNADVRVISGIDLQLDKKLNKLVSEAIYIARKKRFIKASAIVGMDSEFMVKAHLMIPRDESHLLYYWLLNFQYISTEFEKMYKESEILENDGDIYIYNDPNWEDTSYPEGLIYFDSKHNVVAILGMRYFGELKKSTLSIAWAIAHRNGYLPCHAGLKSYSEDVKKTHVAAFFGLSGSGKSTLTHATHDDKYNISILHDDAFIINTRDGSSIALEPSYFDKTADYGSDSYSNKFILAAQNVGATTDIDGNITLVTNDIRNANGRAIKSKFWSKNRIDKMSQPINSVFWIMKDSTLPPIIKVTDSNLAATMGLTLMTKRSTAEALKFGQNYNNSVVEPYANPFRIYPLEEDYKKFDDLFSSGKVECYIINTGDFMGKKITAKHTLKCIEKVISGEGYFEPFGYLHNMKIIKEEGFIPDFNDNKYVDELNRKILERIKFLEKQNDFNKVPQNAVRSLKSLLTNNYILNH